MFFKFLIFLGIIAIPYIQLIGFNGREPKLMLATVVALSLGLFSKCSLKWDYKWFSIFFLYCICAQWLAPKPEAIFNGIHIQNFYIWKILFIWIAHYIGFLAISHNKINSKNILDCMIVCGTIMGFHCIIQNFNLDQFFVVRHIIQEQKQVVGFLGNPTVVAPYIAMIVPLAIYRKRFVFAIIMCIGVLLTMSHVGIGALVVSLLFLASCHNRKLIIPIGIILAVCIGALAYEYFHPMFSKHLFDDSGRIVVWKDILHTISEPFKTGKRFFCTGLGIDSFKFTYQRPIHSPYLQAHCEYLELLYEIGIYGLILFITMFVNLFRGIGIDKKNYHLYASLLCIALVACGTFPFHIGPIAFNTMIILGILNNKESL